MSATMAKKSHIIDMEMPLVIIYAIAQVIIFSPQEA